MKEIDNLEVVKYSYEEIDGEPKIVISMIRANDKNDKYIKFLKMRDAIKILSDKQVKFR